MQQLGGHVVVLSDEASQLGRGESMADTARVLSRYVDAIMIRTDDPRKLAELALHATVPVINGLTDKSHPCQLMADVMTYEEHRGSIADRTVAWSGDANNVARSWVHAAVRFGFRLHMACPRPFRSRDRLLQWVRDQGGEVMFAASPKQAVENADLVVTDTWVSMGMEEAGKAPQRTRTLPGRRATDGMGESRRAVHALPAGASRPRGDGRRNRWAAVGGLGRSREPVARSKGNTCVVSRLIWARGWRNAAGGPIFQRRHK